MCMYTYMNICHMNTCITMCTQGTVITAECTHTHTHTRGVAPMHLSIRPSIHAVEALHNMGSCGIFARVLDLQRFEVFGMPLGYGWSALNRMCRSGRPT